MKDVAMRYFIMRYILCIMVYRVYGAGTPPDIMESPYKHLDLDYTALNDMQVKALQKFHTERGRWNDATVCTFLNCSASRSGAAFFLHLGEIVAPCVIYYMASHGCTCSACTLGVVCGLRRVCCVKRCCNKIVKLTPFEHTKPGMLLMHRFNDLKAAKDARPPAEQVAFLQRTFKRSPRYAPPSPTKEKTD